VIYMLICIYIYKINNIYHYMNMPANLIVNMYTNIYIHVHMLKHLNLPTLDLYCWDAA
jgi:hypothetical protein